MCGHDGHMTCLIGFVPLFLEQIQKIPKNKTIRLLFQPSEEGPISGAELMIKEGCLDGVDEVYGCHQWPTAPLG
jgi:hippurate hydrolase